MKEESGKEGRMEKAATYRFGSSLEAIGSDPSLYDPNLVCLNDFLML